MEPRTILYAEKERERERVSVWERGEEAASKSENYLIESKTLFNFFAIIFKCVCVCVLQLYVNLLWAILLPVDLRRSKLGKAMLEVGYIGGY